MVTIISNDRFIGLSLGLPHYINHFGQLTRFHLASSSGQVGQLQHFWQRFRPSFKPNSCQTENTNNSWCTVYILGLIADIYRNVRCRCDTRDVEIKLFDFTTLTSSTSWRFTQKHPHCAVARNPALDGSIIIYRYSSSWPAGYPDKTCLSNIVPMPHKRHSMYCSNA